MNTEVVLGTQPELGADVALRNKEGYNACLRDHHKPYSWLILLFTLF